MCSSDLRGKRLAVGIASGDVGAAIHAVMVVRRDQSYAALVDEQFEGDGLGSLGSEDLVTGLAIGLNQIFRQCRFRKQKALRFREGRRLTRLVASLEATSAFAIHLARAGQVGVGVGPALDER